MNEHIKTIEIFFKQVKINFTEMYEDSIESFKNIFKGFTGLLKVLIGLFIYILAFALLLCLPLATKLRLNIEKKYKEAIENQKKEIMYKYSPVSRDDE